MKFTYLKLLIFIFIISVIGNAQGTWTQKSSVGGVKRGGAAGFSIGTKGYIATGTYPPSPTCTNFFWEFDPAINIWTQKADFGGSSRNSAIGFSIGTKGYKGTGECWDAKYRDFWEYDQ